MLRTDGDKEMLEMEALSLIILELNYSTPKPEHVQVQSNAYEQREERWRGQIDISAHVRCSGWVVGTMSYTW